MITLRKIFLGTAITMSALACVPHARAEAPTTEFQQGLADREAWESWFNSLSGEYRSGAYFWSGQRSLQNPTPCDSLGGAASMGCYAAKARLDVSDYQRHLAPAYRQGWNSYVAPAPQPAPAPAPPQQPTTIIVQQSMAAPPAPVVAAPIVVAPVPPATSFPSYDVVTGCEHSPFSAKLCVDGGYSARSLALDAWDRMTDSVKVECRRAADQFADYPTLYACLSGHGA
jgi:hypothetical protein